MHLTTEANAQFVQTCETLRHSGSALQAKAQSCVVQWESLYSSLSTVEQSGPKAKKVRTALVKLQAQDEKLQERLSNIKEHLDRLREAQLLASNMTKYLEVIEKAYGTIQQNFRPWNVASPAIDIQPPFPPICASPSPSSSDALPALDFPEFNSAMENLRISVERDVTGPFNALSPCFGPRLVSHFQQDLTNLHLQLQCVYAIYNIAKALNLQAQEVAKVCQEANDLCSRADSLIQESHHGIQQLLAGGAAAQMNGRESLATEANVFCSSAAGRAGDTIGCMTGVVACGMNVIEDKTVIQLNKYCITLNFSLPLLDTAVQDALTTSTSRVRNKILDLENGYNHLTQTHELVSIALELDSSSQKLEAQTQSFKSVVSFVQHQGHLPFNNALDDWKVTLDVVEENIENLELYVSKIAVPHPLWAKFCEERKEKAMAGIESLYHTLNPILAAGPRSREASC
jgi:hypothetical protein